MEFHIFLQQKCILLNCRSAYHLVVLSTFIYEVIVLKKALMTAFYILDIPLVLLVLLSILSSLARSE